MKAFLIFFTIIASVQLCLGVFQDMRTADKNSKYYKKEPQLRQVKFEPFVDTVYEGWISQRLDNFDPLNTETFYMRYLFNTQNFQEGGPIFIFVGGEWTASPGMLQRGHMYDMAQNLSGLLFYTEHRYYGHTYPTPDLTLSNLRYLNIDQALADLAHFITYVKNTYQGARDSGVILVGCSYSATMVTWFRQKYPHLVNGAWATSGPLLAQVDFIEYKEVVSNAIMVEGGNDCSDRIKNAFEQMEQLLADGNSAEISRIFRTCTPLDLNNDLDVWSIFGDVAGPWSGIVQYYSRNDQDIQRACRALEDVEASTDLEAYADWVLARWRIGLTDCYDHTFYGFMEYWNGTTWDDPIALSEWRQWYYQTCAEFGWYQSSGSENILFGSNFPVNISLEICSVLYERFFTPSVVQRNIERTNIIYGAKNPSVSFVYSTHGEFDPWAPMGIDADINENSPVVILPGESHCSDMSSISELDSPEMIQSKERIFTLVQQWLRSSDTATTTTTEETLGTTTSTILDTTTVEDTTTISEDTTATVEDTTTIAEDTTTTVEDTTTIAEDTTATVEDTTITAEETTTNDPTVTTDSTITP